MKSNLDIIQFKFWHLVKDIVANVCLDLKIHSTSILEGVIYVWKLDRGYIYMKLQYLVN